MSDIEDLITDVMRDDLVSAGNRFNELMSDRMAQALDAAKVDVASSVFSAWPGDEGPEDTEDEDDDGLDYSELSDEELDQMLQDLDIEEYDDGEEAEE